MGTEVSTTILESANQAPPSKDTVATPSGRPEAKAATPLWKALAPVAIAVVLVLPPVPSGLAPYGGYFFPFLLA